MKSMKKAMFLSVAAVAAMVSFSAFAGGVQNGVSPYRVTEQNLVANYPVVVDDSNGVVAAKQDRRTQTLSMSATDEAGAQLAGVKCTVSNDKGSWTLVTPGSVDIARSKGDLNVDCGKDGYEHVAGVFHSTPTQIETAHFSWVSDEDAVATVPAYAPQVAVALKPVGLASNN